MPAVRHILALIALTGACTAASAVASDAPTIRDPQDAVAAVKRIVVRHQKACRTDWAKIRALGYKGHWNVTVTVRSSRAGKGTAHWKIGNGWPYAADAFAQRLAHGCGRS